MPRRTLKRLLPEARYFRKEKSLRHLGDLLHNPDLWHLNRNKVAAAVSVGLFMAFVPLPFQMLLAAAAAILIGCNLPVAVLVVWVSNPITMPPLFFAAYKVGARLLGEVARPVQFEMSINWLLTTLGTIWQPFLLGCLVLGVISAILGNIAARVLWRLHIIRRWRERKARRLKRTSTT